MLSECFEVIVKVFRLNLNDSKTRRNASSAPYQITTFKD